MATDGFSATINFAIKIPPFCFGLQYVRRQNAALKSDGFGVLLVRGFVLVRHIGGDLKIALVFGVVCIGVKGFFCGSAASARLWLSRCGGRQDRFWVGSWHHAPLQEPFDIFVGSWYTTSNRCESVGGDCVAFPVLSCS